MRADGRAAGELRPIAIETGFVRTATGSALIAVGGTRVICTASGVEGVPRWMTGSGRGWVTAEYGMLPASTGERKQRDAYNRTKCWTAWNGPTVVCSARHSERYRSATTTTMTSRRAAPTGALWRSSG